MLTEADVQMIYEALRFADWAAGQGICPADGEPCKAPDEFLYDWSTETEDEDWEGMPAKFRALLSTRPSSFTAGD